MAKLRPLSNNLLIKRAESEEKTPGGLYVPDKAQEKPHRGRVIAAGPGYHTDNGTFVPTSCEPGDIVVFARGTGVEVTLDGETYTIVSEDAVLGVAEA